MSYNRRIPAATLAAQSASPRFIEGGGAGVPAEHQATIALSTRDSLMCGAKCRSAIAMQRVVTRRLMFKGGYRPKD